MLLSTYFRKSSGDMNDRSIFGIQAVLNALCVRSGSHEHSPSEQLCTSRSDDCSMLAVIILLGRLCPRYIGLMLLN